MMPLRSLRFWPVRSDAYDSPDLNVLRSKVEPAQVGPFQLEFEFEVRILLARIDGAVEREDDVGNPEFRPTRRTLSGWQCQAIRN